MQQLNAIQQEVSLDQVQEMSCCSKKKNCCKKFKKKGKACKSCPKFPRL